MTSKLKVVGIFYAIRELFPLEKSKVVYRYECGANSGVFEGRIQADGGLVNCR